MFELRWWNETRESMFREVNGDLYSTSCLSADFESEIVLDMRRSESNGDGCNGEEQGASGREYALISEWIHGNKSKRKNDRLPTQRPTIVLAEIKDIRVDQNSANMFVGQDVLSKEKGIIFVNLSLWLQYILTCEILVGLVRLQLKTKTVGVKKLTLL
ncbi:hypothetical protein M8C21_017811 [Ambrosia artemisiifolia]|uniref:Uncharacterized protein n=1 Tax=Ambrosia artemisiifolia TaxID=4212 RepID=A0AAD5D835_AMBAR|nr:hypothetical protein M8C21_017811 [Ambrosia artemisiifolia]